MICRFNRVTAGLVVIFCQVYSPALAAQAGEAESNSPTSIGALQVERLERLLERYGVLAAAGGWPTLPHGPTIEPGFSGPRVELLRQRLLLSGDLLEGVTSDSTPEYDQALQDAVRRFQLRHGLKVDALVGPATLRALNISIDQRIAQVRVNLERMRGLSASLVGDLLLVNVAAFNARVVRNGEITWETKIIVGEVDNETPEFQSALRQVVFNPTWTVPFSIATKEMLPKMKQDPDFFVTGGYRLYDRDGNRTNPAEVEWGSFSRNNFPFTLVQQPGPANQLGQIKFTMPNEYSVCMHDTPAKSLFSQAARAFSHGCIRVEDPVGFAEVLLGNKGWTRDMINSQIHSGETRSVALAVPLPIYVVYLTAEVDDAGTVYFYEDIYARDARVLKGLHRSSQSNQFQ